MQMTDWDSIEAGRNASPGAACVSVHAGGGDSALTSAARAEEIELAAKVGTGLIVQP